MEILRRLRIRVQHTALVVASVIVSASFWLYIEIQIVIERLKAMVHNINEENK